MQALDSWWKRVTRPGLLLLAVIVLGAGLVACGSGDEEDSGGSEATSTPAVGGSTGSGGVATATSTAGGGTSTGSDSNVGTEKGNQIANDAMLVVADLPGSGWVLVGTDEFEGSLLDGENTELVNVPACDTYVKKVTEAAAKARDARVGRAARSFGQPNSLSGMSVDIEVAVYKDSRSASTLISEAKGAFGAADFERCFREMLKTSDGGVPVENFELKAGKPLASVPNNGMAQAYDISLSSEGVTFSLHAELYAWANKNATAFVTVFGSPEEIKADVVTAAVSKSNEKLSKAQ